MAKDPSLHQPFFSEQRENCIMSFVLKSYGWVHRRHKHYFATYIVNNFDNNLDGRQFLCFCLAKASASGAVR